MEKDREPAVDAIATRFSTILDTMGALTSRCSQIAGLSLCRARIEDGGWCSLAHLERYRSLVLTDGCSHHKAMLYLV